MKPRDRGKKEVMGRGSSVGDPIMEMPETDQ